MLVQAFLYEIRKHIIYISTIFHQLLFVFTNHHVVMVQLREKKCHDASWWFCSSVKALRKVNVRKCRPTLRSCALKTTCRIMVYILWNGIHRMNKCSNLPGDIFEVSYHLYCMQKVTHCGVWDLFFFVILNISGANLILFKSFWPRLCI